MVKRLRRNVWDRSFRAMPIALVRRCLRGKGIAPCYHLVSDRPPTHVEFLYECRTVTQFQRELDFLLAHFKPLSLQDAARAIRETGQLPANSLFLSFDDGFREVHETIAPICFAKGVPATFFLNTDFLDNRALCFRHKASILSHHCETLGRERSEARLAQLGIAPTGGIPRDLFLSVSYQQAAVLDSCAEALGVDFSGYLQTRKPYLTTAQVEDLVRQGFAIGGHSLDHPLYRSLTLDEQLHQTRGCMAELNRRFQLPIKAFAFPFVSDGVGSEFYRTILSEGTADLIFCLGGKPEGGAERSIERFGVERMHSADLTVLLREEANRRLLAWVRRRRNHQPRITTCLKQA